MKGGHDHLSPELLASCGLVRVHGCSCGSLRLTVGPVTITLSEAALEQVAEASQAGLAFLAAKRNIEAPSAPHLSLVAASDHDRPFQEPS